MEKSRALKEIHYLNKRFICHLGIDYIDYISNTGYLPYGNEKITIDLLEEILKYKMDYDLDVNIKHFNYSSIVIPSKSGDLHYTLNTIEEFEKIFKEDIREYKIKNLLD